MSFFTQKDFDDRIKGLKNPHRKYASKQGHKKYRAHYKFGQRKRMHKSIYAMEELVKNFEDMINEQF